MFKKVEKNYINVILNKVKVNLSKYLLCINTINIVLSPKKNKYTWYLVISYA